MARTHVMVFCYDVSRDGARARVAALLETQLIRVQKSVFEGRLSSKAARTLARQAGALLDEGDSLRVYAVTPAGLRQSIALGSLPLPEAHNYWML